MRKFWELKENFDIDEGLDKELDEELPEEPLYNIINGGTDEVTLEELMQLKELALGFSEIGSEAESSMNYEIPDISDLTPIDSELYLYGEVEQKSRRR